MDPLTLALVNKAESSLATAERELAVRVHPNYDAVCHHSGMCVERYLKARLMEDRIPFPEYTRHLVVLLELCLEQDARWDVFRSHLRAITTHEFQAADPEYVTTFESARESLELCQAFRRAARAQLGF